MFSVFSVCYYLVVSTGTIDCLERLVSAMTYYVSCEMLNPTLTQTVVYSWYVVRCNTFRFYKYCCYFWLLLNRQIFCGNCKLGQNPVVSSKAFTKSCTRVGSSKQALAGNALIKFSLSGASMGLLRRRRSPSILQVSDWADEYCSRWLSHLNTDDRILDSWWLHFLDQSFAQSFCSVQRLIWPLSFGLSPKFGLAEQKLVRK